MALIEDVIGLRCCHCERSEAISSPVDAYHTVKTLPRRKPGPTLRALSRRMNGSRLSQGKSSGGGTIEGGSAARPVVNSQ